MSDLIDRQAAIDELTRFTTPHDNGDGTMTVGVLSKSSITDILNDLPSAQPEPCEDAVSRQAVYNVLDKMPVRGFKKDGETIHGLISLSQVNSAIINLPSAQPTLYGYNIEHLELIARVLQKEDLPPERVVEMLKDIGRIVAIVRDEFEEALRKAVEQCMT